VPRVLGLFRQRRLVRELQVLAHELEDAPGPEEADVADALDLDVARTRTLSRRGGYDREVEARINRGHVHAVWQGAVGVEFLEQFGSRAHVLRHRIQRQRVELAPLVWRTEGDQRAHARMGVVMQAETRHQAAHAVRDHHDARCCACRSDVLDERAEAARGSVQIAVERPVVVSDGIPPAGARESPAEKPQARSRHEVPRDEDDRRPPRAPVIRHATPGEGAERDREDGDDRPQRLDDEPAQGARQRSGREAHETHLGKVQHLVERDDEARELRDDDRAAHRLHDARDEPHEHLRTWL
jgi:hypothetical protein